MWNYDDLGEVTMKLNVIYEDNHIIVVEKPIHVPVQADSSGDLDFLPMVQQSVKEKYNYGTHEEYGEGGDKSARSTSQKQRKGKDKGHYDEHDAVSFCFVCP